MARSELSGDVIAAALLAAVLVAVGVIADSGGVAWAVGLPAFVLLVYCAVRAPLRYSLMVLTACALMLENPSDRPADGMWTSPVYLLGALMLAHMNQTSGQSWMALSANEVFVFILTLVAYLRRTSGSTLDSRERDRSPKPLRQLALLSLAGTAYVELWGILRGGDFSKSLWQADKVVYIPILFLLFDQGLRDQRDYIALGRILLIAACYKAMVAVYVMNFIPWGDKLPSYATSHHDSLLFANAVILLISLLIHGARKRVTWKVALIVFPIVFAGMMANNRRMAWVQIGLVFLTVYIAMPSNPVKRRISKALRIATPILLVYAAIGWSSPTGVFKPIATIQSVVKPAKDLSTMTRDIENYDIAVTIREHPIMGSGYGHGYIEVVSLPPMPHPLERYLPHNSLLGLWFASGFIGYTMMSLLWTGGIYFGIRAYRMAKRPLDRAVSLLGFGAVLMYMIQMYGDVGLGSWIAVYTVAPAIAIAGKLAVAMGAWAPRKSKKKPAELPAAATTVQSEPA